MSNFTIRVLLPDDREWIAEFMTAHWGADKVVAHDEVYYPSQLPGFMAVEDEQAVGLVTYHLNSEACEIVTLNSLHSNKGIGTALIGIVIQVAREACCTRLWLVTTNDNLDALNFYQKRGFVLVAVHRNAATQARKLKPEIPRIGNNGILIRDEIELEMRLSGDEVIKG